MDRRKLLKTMTYAMGATIATPTLLSLWTSCKPSIENTWTPLFLNTQNLKIMQQISHIILPLSPSEKSLAMIPQFIDLILSDVCSKNAQKNFLNGADLFKQAFRYTHNKNITEAHPNEIKSIINHYLNVSKEKETAIFKTIDKGDLSKDNNTELYIYNYLLFIRKYSIWGYTTSNLSIASS